MKKIYFLALLFFIGCSSKHSHIKFDNNDLNKIIEGADSEAWCEVVYCVNGPGHTGAIKLQTYKISDEAQQLVFFGISSDCHNDYNKVKVKRINTHKYDAFIKKLVDIGIFNMNDIDLNKLPVNENSMNPWEASFTKIPNATSYIEFYYFIKIGDKKHNLHGFEINIYKDIRYKKIIEMFSEFFGQRLGGIIFNKPSS